jgi:hypothetical protein
VTDTPAPGLYVNRLIGQDTQPRSAEAGIHIEMPEKGISFSTCQPNIVLVGEGKGGWLVKDASRRVFLPVRKCKS